MRSSQRRRWVARSAIRSCSSYGLLTITVGDVTAPRSRWKSGLHASTQPAPPPPPPPPHVPVPVADEPLATVPAAPLPPAGPQVEAAPPDAGLAFAVAPVPLLPLAANGADAP